jgi:hypothetical protein
MPRSGTKLLRTLLNRNPRVCVLERETELLPRLASWVAEHGPAVDEAAFAQVYEAVRLGSFFHYRHRASGDRGWHEWRAACAGRFDVAGLFEGLVRWDTGLERSSDRIWGDKSPSYITHLDLIQRIYPEAKVIHIVRDVRDYCASVRTAWRKDVRRAAHRWNEGVLAASRHCKRDPARGIQVRYEDLTRMPRTELERLCAFLGIAFDERMLTLERALENFGNARGQAKIVADNAGKFTRVLRPAEIEGIEAIAWEGMCEFGYEPHLARGPRQLSAASLAVRKLRDGFVLALNDAGKRGRLRAALFHLGHHRTSRG